MIQGCLVYYRRFRALIACAAFAFIVVYLSLYPDEWIRSLGKSGGRTRRSIAGPSYDSGKKHDAKRKFKIAWFNPPVFLRLRPEAMFSGFKGCPYSNCFMTYNRSNARSSDAVIFTGRLFPRKLPFERPAGQVWVFYEHEPPYRFNERGTMWRRKDTFNWTMTYNKDNADIHLPYGKITEKSKPSIVNYTSIIERKKHTALIILSHCDTPSQRLKYVQELKQEIDVDILGKCGTKWTCGKRFVHDDCFEIINEYKFFLAFENSFCDNYFTEKIYDNFDYNTVLVTRGGKRGQIKNTLPQGTFISANDFKNARELGKYLRSMSLETYLNILRRKERYTSVNSYSQVFHDAMCDLCQRMNHQDRYKQTIKDMAKWAYSSRPCVRPADINGSISNS